LAASSQFGLFEQVHGVGHIQIDGLRARLAILITMLRDQGIG
jgi:hypothetical protein